METMNELAKENKKLTEALTMIEEQIQATKTRLNQKQKHLRWYNFSKRIKAHALKHKLCELFESRAEVLLIIKVTSVFFKSQLPC